MAQQKEIARYPFTKDIEAAIAFAEVSLPRFHDAVGHALDPDRMPSPEGANLIRAGQAIAKATGAGCPNPVLALQHMRTTVHAGRMRKEEVDAASAFLDQAEDSHGAQDMEALVAVVVPVIQRFAQQEALEAAFDDFGKGNGIHETADRFEKVASLGKRKGTIGQILSGSEDDVKACANSILRDPLPTGIPELDEFLKGGLERAAMGCIMGTEGAGKSLALCHFTVEALLRGIDSAYLSLELGIPNVKQRIYSNLTSMTKEQLGKNPTEASRRLQSLKLGNLIVAYQTPKATTAASVKAWLRAVEKEHGFVPRLVVIDYADKLVSKLETNKRSYEEMEIVYDCLRDMIIERDGWLWTASQMTRGASKSKKPDLDDVSDSKHKVRTPDLVLSLIRSEQDKEDGVLKIGVPKRRNEQAFGTVGPLPLDEKYGRIVTVNRPEPWRIK